MGYTHAETAICASCDRYSVASVGVLIGRSMMVVGTVAGRL